MIQAVIFDMFETLIIHCRSPLYFGTWMAEEEGFPSNRESIRCFKLSGY